MALYTSIISVLVIAGLAIFVNEFATQFDGELNACGLGEFKDGACQCVHPYVGSHCEVADCGYGRLINSLFESSQITTPNPNSEYGCACESKFWGYSCSQCTAKYTQDCSGPCENTYFGARCDTMCKEGTASDAEGFAHAEAGGTYNFFVANQGICLNDGSVRCNPRRAGEHCEFECLDCLYGSCNLADGTCDCFQGYYGDLCNATCPGRCSGNRGVCKEDGTCNCDNGFTGDDCSLDCCIRDGGTAIGRVHGDCNPLGGCICDAGWSGPNCDCNDATTCGGRGTCINNTGICGCLPQFQGARCEMCDDLMIGPFCQYDRFQCPSQQVQNGQFVAINTRGDYACKCDAGFQGSTCESCTPSAYPKNGTEMCSFVIPASLCNRGTVKPTYQGTGIMCDCELNFDPAQDCGACKTKYFGSDCEIFCDVLCTNSGGECTVSGCKCPKGKSSVNGECVLCGGDVDCAGGECVDGRCICDPGYYGDSCSISAPVFDGKVCNGYSSVLEFETADCDTDTDCTTVGDTTMPIENQQVAFRANQFGRTDSTFCHRLDTPIALKDTTGCCVDANADGKCDAANLFDNPCGGEVVSDICNQRVLEGEVNVFQWCTSVQLGCLKNGECADPVLCEDRCDAGLNSTQWEDRWGVDHSQSMETVMNESWKFPIHFADPYNVRDFYNTASLDDVCPSGYNFCRDALIPPDATIYNATHKFVTGWQPMPSFHSCELDHHIIQNVNGVYIYNFSSPIWVERIELVSDTTTTAAFARLGQGNAAYYGNVSTYIDSIALYGKGDVELIIYNYTTDACVDLMRRSASTFAQCKNYAFYEFEYDWDDFCDWRDSLGNTSGFEQRCYDQSLVCAGCENWQENCENLPLESEYPSPMPAPCTPWDGFCEDYLNVSVRQTGTCAYTKCECEGYGVGGEACNLQCVVPRFVNSESACGSDLDPPWGQCEEHRGVIAFGMEQGECNCFNGGDPNLGCALVCTGEQDCSSDIDTPFSFTATNCSDFSDVYLVEEIEGESDPFRCHVHLRDSLCNFFRGRCECATPYTVFTTMNQTVYYNMDSYRVSLMQGYGIDEYAPFALYTDPGESLINVVNEGVLCTDEFVYPVVDSFVCSDTKARKNTDVVPDENLKRCKDYTVEDCGKIRNSTLVPSDEPCEEDILDKQTCLEYGATLPSVVTRTNEQKVITKEIGRCSVPSCSPGNAVCPESAEIQIIETEPYLLINSGSCDIYITTADECAAAGQMIKRNTNRHLKFDIDFLDLYAIPSNPVGLKGCYYDSLGLYFNPYGGFNKVTASDTKTSICKKDELYLDSQALMRQLDCVTTADCSAIQYSERESRMFTEFAFGDGFIMSDCLIFTKMVLRNENKLFVQSGNYLIWDLQGTTNVYGVDLTTNLNQISPNGRTFKPLNLFHLTPHVRLHGGFENPKIRVTVSELSEDVSLDLSLAREWNFVKDLEFELKPDLPPSLTVDGVCAGTYNAGAALVGKKYTLKLGFGKCMNSAGALLTKLSAGAPLYSVHPVEECKLRCDSAGASGFSVQISDYSCQCSPSCNIALIDSGFNAYTIDDVDEAAKTPAELQGDWVSGDYKLRKNQKREFGLGRCIDKLHFQGAYCTLSVTKEACFSQLSEIQSCAEYDNSVCKVFCTAEGTGCCEGESVTPAHASFTPPYVLDDDTVGYSTGEAGRVASFYTPAYECLWNLKPYIFIDDRLCDTSSPPIGRDWNSKYSQGSTLLGYSDYSPPGMQVRDWNEAYELDPLHALSMPDKVEECARRCAIEGYEEFTIIQKKEEKRCMCNDDCMTGPNGNLRLNNPNFPSSWSDGTNTILYTFESYRILDLFVAAYSDVEMSCEQDDYVSVDAGLPEFDGIVFTTEYVTDGYMPALYDVPDGYFKVFNNEVPNLMTKKCVYKQSFTFNDINTRFVKFSAHVSQFLPHAIELFPLVTSTNIVESSKKSGCVIKNNEVTYYDFMPTAISSVPLDCKYKLLAREQRCAFGVQLTGIFSLVGCASSCGSAFHHTAAGNCFCDPFNCANRVADSSANAYLWGGNDCIFESLEEGVFCQNYVPVAGLIGLVECAGFCRDLGYTAFDSYIGQDNCACSTDNCEVRVTNPTYATYRIKPAFDEQYNFVHITDKSCEHYGHRTIMDEELCARAASEFDSSPENMLANYRYGRCEDATSFSGVEDVLECNSECGGRAFSLRHQGNYFLSGVQCSTSNVLYTVMASGAWDCELPCTNDMECNFFTFDQSNFPFYCQFHKSCIPDAAGLPGWEKNNFLFCACSEDCVVSTGLFRTTGNALTATPASTGYVYNPSVLHSPIATSSESVPRLVDIDGDGDLDLFVTANNVAVRYFENIGDPTTPNFQEQTGANNPLGLGVGNMGIHCGLSGVVIASACYFDFGDLDNDGDIDVVFVEYGSNTHDLVYYENNGTPSSPNFVLSTLNDAYNAFSVDLRNWGCPDPALICSPLPTAVQIEDFDGDGDLDILLLIDAIETSFGTPSPSVRTILQTPWHFITVSSPSPYRYGVGSYVSAGADLDDDGLLELFYRTSYVSNTDGNYAVWVQSGGAHGTSDPLQLNFVLGDGDKDFGDLDGDGVWDVVVGTAPEVRFSKNHGTKSVPNFNDPEWVKEGCISFCPSHMGFQFLVHDDTKAFCYCTSDFASAASNLPFVIYQPDPDIYSSYISNIPITPRGCSTDYFTDENIQTECTDCVCIEGATDIEPDYVKITIGTCVSNGYVPIGFRSECYSAALKLGYENVAVADWKTDALAYDSEYVGMPDFPLGCVWDSTGFGGSERPYYGDGAVDCSPTQTCICKRSTMYELIDGSSTCESNFLHAIRTPEECLAANTELGVGATSTYQVVSTTVFGCLFSSGAITFEYQPWVNDGEGTMYNGNTRLCRNVPYPSKDYTIIFEDAWDIEEVCNKHNLYAITDEEQCTRAAIALGLPTDGVHPLGSMYTTYDETAYANDGRYGCTYWTSGVASVSTNNNFICSPGRPCLCSRYSPAQTSELPPHFALRETVEYVSRVESKYEIMSTCGDGFDEVGTRECELVRQIHVTAEPDCSNVCKHSASECDDDESCICHSDTEVTVFDSNASCAICGGGESFVVGSSFFNENGNTRGCIYSEETTCSTTAVGWTQYVKNYNFRGNNSAYQVSEFQGYCENSHDIVTAYDVMDISEILDHCQKNCRSHTHFSINRYSCKCTQFCEDPEGAELFTTFEYTGGNETIYSMQTDEFVEKWDDYDPNIACFKDLDHKEHVRCDWIRALKHFARGASYRVGDCHHLGPGVGEGVASQIPCSGHGFLSGGTCACDYAEQFEIKDTGIGLTFELPNLRQTPFRGKGCQVMCPGFNLWTMESVCSGHGRCESDGRCACDQGYVGYKCHLACETTTDALTCSGHGVCNVVEAPISRGWETIQSLNCSGEGEIMYLARDRVIEVENGYYYMYQDSQDLVVEHYRTSVSTIVDFSTATDLDFIVKIDEGEIQNDPEIRVCPGTTLVKTFEGSPLSIIDNNGHYIVSNWNQTDQIEITVTPGTYTYFCPTNQELMGTFIVESCPDFEIRNATIDDFYIEGRAFRQPYNTASLYPYMPCVDTISLKREEATHPLLRYTTPDVFINCSLMPGNVGTAYRIICGECVCESSSSSGHWTGHNCRTPSLGFLGEDGKTSCPGMVNEIPCNGRGTCDWGSVDGLGNQLYSSSNCFCGDTSINANYTTAPRNDAGDLILHAMNFGIPLYQDQIDFFEGSDSSCPEGTEPVSEAECIYDKTGSLTTLEARIYADQEYVLSASECVQFDSTSTESIERVTASDELVIEGANQKFKCASACFGHYRFKANGKIGTMLMRDSLSGTFEENVQTCAFLCLDHETPIDDAETPWDRFGLRGFSVNAEGKCYCESYGAVLLSEEWRTFEYVIPYKEVDGGLCILNNVLVYSNIDDSVKTNPGMNTEKRIENCARECQAFEYELSGTILNSQGFSYQDTNAVCHCETLSNECTVRKPMRRFNFDYFNTFNVQENSECRCGVSKTSTSNCLNTLTLPGVKPSVFVLQGETETYRNFVCRNNNNHVCRASSSILNNFISDCNCREEFTGPLCETARMMCILGGSELDGESCACPQTDKQNPKGCCSYGLQWNQDRYSRFSALQDFFEISDNVFYKDSLLAVCKPLDQSSYQNPGYETDAPTVATRQHNYVATTNDHIILGQTACNAETEVSLYKPVFKFTETKTAHIGEALDIFADNTVAYFSDHNAKMRCLDHCTINYDVENNGIPKGFTLKTIKTAADTSAYAGEQNNMPWAFRCYCNENQAYVDNGMKTGPTLARRHKLSDTVISTSSVRHTNKACTTQGTVMSMMKYLHGAPIQNNCVSGLPLNTGEPPTGATLDITDYAVHTTESSSLLGLRLSSDDENYNADPKQECAERCGREGFDSFWVNPSFNLFESGFVTNDLTPFEEVDICQCFYSHDVVTLNAGIYEQDISQYGASEMCSIYSDQSRLQAITKTCFHAGFELFNWNTEIWAHCFMEAACAPGTDTGSEIRQFTDPDIFDTGESIVGDVYDIVFPQGSRNFECMQTEHETLRHVDVAGLNGVTDNDGLANEIGVPYSLEPHLLNVKTTIATMNGQFDFNQCLSLCKQQKQEDNRINSIVFKALFETTDLVFANGFRNTQTSYFSHTPVVNGSQLPRCFGPCVNDDDCETGLCLYRGTNGGTIEITATTSCRETDTLSNQYGSDVSFPMQGGTKFCAVSQEDYINMYQCDCTENDDDFESERYTKQSENGKCEGGTDIGAPLSSTEPFYDADRYAECRARCLQLDPDTKAFYVKISDKSCGCSSSYCKIEPDNNYEVYSIVAPFGDSCDKVEGFLLALDTGLYTEPVADRSPNPLTCNIESYLNYGTIMDSGSCECPLYDYEIMYQDSTDYTTVGNYEFSQHFVDNHLHYPQLKNFGTISLAACKQACNEYPDCVEITHDGSDCNGMISSDLFYNNKGVADWRFKKVSDRLCKRSLSTRLLLNAPTIEDCMKELVEYSGATSAAFLWAVPRGHTGGGGLTFPIDFECSRIGNTEKTLYGYIDNQMDPTMLEKDANGDFICEDPVSSHFYHNFVPRSGTPYEKSSVSLGWKVPTYLLIQEGAYFPSQTTTRYRKTAPEANSYCSMGEVLQYEESEHHLHSNPHYCMQECRKTIEDGFVLSRGNIADGRFSCFCSDKIYEECVLESRSTFMQYKVHKYNTAYSSTERLMSPLDPQIGDTNQCKCQGYYISGGEAFSCPENTFKNSGHCTAECEKCPQGKSSQMGATRCEQCPAGKISTGSDCVPCGVGEYASILDTSCQMCPAGRFNLKSGVGQCEACPAGYFDDDATEGLICKSCPTGSSTAELTARVECTLCESGKYNDLVGQPECKLCRTGRYATTLGLTQSSQCSQCLKGEYNNEEGALSCKKCPPGKRNNNLARPLCSNCRIGKAISTSGALSCKECLEGRYAGTEGLSDCKACRAGLFTYERGAFWCISCNTGEYSSGAATECEECPIGYYQTKIGASSCTQCDQKNPGSVRGYKYSYPSTNFNPSYEDTACDLVFDNSAWSNADFNYWAYYDATASKAFDCAGRYGHYSANGFGDGVTHRRFCWVKKTYGSCNSVMKTYRHDDAISNNAWFERPTTGASDFKWCIPRNQQNREHDGD